MPQAMTNGNIERRVECVGGGGDDYQRKLEVGHIVHKVCPGASLTASSMEQSLLKKPTVAALLKRFRALCAGQNFIILCDFVILRLTFIALHVVGTRQRGGMNIS